MIDPIMTDLHPVLKSEYLRAKADHGDVYHSPHEAWGVLMEEWDEVCEEIEQAGERLRDIAREVRRDDAQGLAQTFGSIQLFAMRAAAELIQVAAVCWKAVDTMEAKEGAHDPQRPEDQAAVR